MRGGGIPMRHGGDLGGGGDYRCRSSTVHEKTDGGYLINDD